MPPFFIIGCDRSGTTLLRVMLASHSQLFIPPETSFLPRLFDRATDYGDFSAPCARWFFVRDLQLFPATRKTRSLDVLGLTHDEAYAALCQAQPCTYPSACDAIYRAAAAKLGKTRWADKTPDYTFYVAQLAAMFPDSKFIHLIRDPRAVALSVMNADFGEDTAAGGAQRWRTRVQTARNHRDSLGPNRYTELKFEDLLINPPACLQTLCNWLGLDYENEMLAYHRHSAQMIRPEHRNLFPLIDQPPELRRIDAWRSELKLEELAQIVAIASPLMHELGYL
jgi:hypothetical protein